MANGGESFRGALEAALPTGIAVSAEPYRAILEKIMIPEFAAK